MAIGLGTVVVGSHSNASGNLVGYMDDVRISDTALYTADFTPPNAIPYDLPVAPVGKLIDVDRYLSAFPMPDTHLYDAAALTATNDLYYGGDGRIVGTTRNTPALPVSRRVRLHERNSGHLVREGWSDSAGNYAFDYLNRGYTYYVVGFDHTGQYQGVVADKLVPEVMA